MRNTWPAGAGAGVFAVLALAWAAAGCSDDSRWSRAGDGGVPPTDSEARAQRPSRPSFCAREGDDVIRDVFCADELPALQSLVDLQLALRLTPGPASTDAQSAGDDFYVRFPVLLGHSTALSGQLVSQLNPRALVVGIGTILAFQRGVQHVELATLARGRRAFNFYLLSFDQACNRAAHGCRPVDLFTSRIERGWLGYSVRDADDLANTALDCRQCHQRGRDDGILLMRELERPWTHFFEPIEGAAPIPGAPPDPPGPRGSDLMRDFLAAHGDEPYANIGIQGFPHSTASILQTSVASTEQPVYFDSQRIEAERYPYRDGAYPSQPEPSPTWERAYEAFKRGEQLALPYVEMRATDPGKQAALTEALKRWRAGVLDDEEFPDLGDVFPDDPMVRARIGLQVEPGAGPVDALIQACGSCHNDVLDQSLSRANFNIDVSRLDRKVLDRAIERLQLDPDAAGAMPPRTARQLDSGTRERLIEYLRTEARNGEADPRLVRAAELGMTGGSRAAAMR